MISHQKEDHSAQRNTAGIPGQKRRAPCTLTESEIRPAKAGEIGQVDMVSQDVCFYEGHLKGKGY